MLTVALAVCVVWPANVSERSAREAHRLVAAHFPVRACRGSTDGIRVVALQGLPKRPILGQADRAERIAWIWPDAVRRSTRAEGRVLDLAIGRAAAHEIVHLLVPERDHWGDGLMAETIPLRVLTARRVFLRLR